MPRLAKDIPVTDVRGQPLVGAAPAKAPDFVIPKRAARANAGRFSLHSSGQNYNTWFYRAEYDTDLKTLLTPDFWAHVASQIRKTDKIEVLTAGGLMAAEFFVLKADDNTARLKLRHVDHLYDLKPEDMETETHRVVYRGEIENWAVVRKNDSVLMKGDFTGPDEAVQFMRDHLKAFAA